jgi:HAD superfamily hydrolase (TIGR01509 family)
MPVSSRHFAGGRNSYNPAMRYELVIFDMDGTLAEELLDFAAIRAEIGLPPELPILEEVAKLSAEAQVRAHEVLDRHESAAAETCRLHAGASETLGELRRRGVKVALLTRNSARCARAVLGRHGLMEHFEWIATRETPPYKPHPDSILNIVRRLGALPERTLMVGDYLYDLQAAAAAKVDSALLCLDGGELPPFAGSATYLIRSLWEVSDHVFRPQGKGELDR